jgi:hypothetical protein
VCVFRRRPDVPAWASRGAAVAGRRPARQWLSPCPPSSILAALGRPWPCPLPPSAQNIQKRAGSAMGVRMRVGMDHGPRRRRRPQCRKCRYAAWPSAASDESHPRLQHPPPHTHTHTHTNTHIHTHTHTDRHLSVKPPIGLHTVTRCPMDVAAWGRASYQRRGCCPWPCARPPRAVPSISGP